MITFNRYSSTTLNIINRANALQKRKLVLPELRQIAMHHQIIGVTSIKCTVSQLDTVKTPDIAW